MNDSATAHRIRVRIAEYKAAKGDAVLVAVGLGSCVGVALYDSEHEVGGMSHILLPGNGKPGDNPGKFSETSIQSLVDSICAMGGDVKTMKAKVVGGANMFAWVGEGKKTVGERNVEASREKLARLGVPIEAEHVGGSEGRTVEFHAASGRMVVRNARGDEKEI